MTPAVSNSKIPLSIGISVRNGRISFAPNYDQETRILQSIGDMLGVCSLSSSLIIHSFHLGASISSYHTKMTETYAQISLKLRTIHAPERQSTIHQGSRYHPTKPPPSNPPSLNIKKTLHGIGRERGSSSNALNEPFPQHPNITLFETVLKHFDDTNEIKKPPPPSHFRGKSLKTFLKISLLF